ncbi:unnamed protein product [Rotaria socialis]|uniref:UBC core domain-containing protein n=1 Tax=Rotaria socialis TaxID=392032 RepID=A0A820L0I3_9BILA|nr:unnamed protein product [Rotaria socialis]CAF4158908.1 unnamed protein product [Rotaria socialis]CAF4348613.1 unnamed protein product [Rotaria socialis]CAF4424694.1 unnamed protein product [Rotaria socialis]CAF4667489.1 unnamed protein product [Rotaria socialis]
MSLLRCLAKQLKEMENDPPPLCQARPAARPIDMFNWNDSIRGPKGSPNFKTFLGGLSPPQPTPGAATIDYPFKPPRIRFTTLIYHPNISTQGDICLDILHDKRSPALTIRTALLSLCSLLTDPNPEHGLDNEILNVYRTNKNFSFQPPQIQFTVTLCHPNICTTGEIRLDVLHSQWSPIITIRNLLIWLCSLLTDPNPERGLNQETLNFYRTNQDKFSQTAKECTKHYAIENKVFE